MDGVAFSYNKGSKVSTEVVDVPFQSVASEKRRRRWQRQTVAQELLPGECVSFCMKHVKGGGGVDIMRDPKTGATWYSGLRLCGSVWHCPLCSSKISYKRREELSKGVEQCINNGGVVLMATYTIAHTKKDALPYLVKGLEDSMKRMRQGRSAQQMKASFGVMGTVTVREVTYGANGWHPHMHQLIFLKSEVDTETFGEVLYEKWQRATQREGLTMNEHGFSLTSTYSRVENYIAKFGIESDQSWTVADELTMGQSGKQPRSDRGVTPFGMLDLVAAGQDEYATLFREYATWYKGKRQLVWSKGLKAALLGDEEELTDHEIAEMEPEIEEAEGLPLVFICLSRAQWHFIIINDLRGEILEQARRGDLESMKEFLAMISGPLDKSQLIA